MMGMQRDLPHAENPICQHFAYLPPVSIQSRLEIPMLPQAECKIAATHAGITVVQTVQRINLLKTFHDDHCPI